MQHTKSDPLTLRNVLTAFPFVGALAAGWPLEGSVVAMICYPLWTVLVGAAWVAFFASRETSLGDDPNRAHARHLMSCLIGVVTIIWFGFVAALAIARIFYAVTPDRSVIFMAGWIGLFAPVGVAGTLFSLIMYFEWRDWRMMLLRGATFASTLLPLWWVVWEAKY